MASRSASSSAETFPWIALEKDIRVSSLSAGLALRSHRGEAGKQLGGVAAPRLSSRLRRELSGWLKLLDAVHRHVAPKVGEVRPEQDLVKTDDIPQHPQD